MKKTGDATVTVVLALFSERAANLPHFSTPEDCCIALENCGAE